MATERFTPWLMPDVDVYESDGELVIDLEVPSAALDADCATASFENGILEVRVPKKAARALAGFHPDATPC